MSDATIAWGLFLLPPLLSVAYLWPALWAIWHRHPRECTILLVNLFLGWTGLGWAIVYVWAQDA